MKIAWLDINASYSHSSLAIPALDAQLGEQEREKHQWKVVSGYLKTANHTIIEELVSFKPEIILSTLWLYNQEKVMELLGKIVALLPTVRVILGGPQFLGDNSHFFAQYPFVEALFRGEGEEVFPSFIENLEFSESGERSLAYQKLEGFCTPTSDNGKATLSSFAALKPAEESPYFKLDKPFVQLETSRGCFNRCAFCISGDGRKVDELSVESIAARIEALYHKGVREFRIVDRTFNANQKRAVELIELFSKYGGEVEFHLEIHPSLLGELLREALAKAPAGSLHLEAGIQSFHPPVLALCDRYDKREKTIEGLTFIISLQKHLLHTDLIAGLPAFTYSQLLEDLHLLIELYPDEIQLESLKLLPGTKFRERAEEFQLKYSPTPPYQVLESDAITYRELQLAESLSIAIDHYYNRAEWRDLLRIIALKEDKFLPQLAQWLLDRGIKKSLSSERRGELLWNFCKESFPSYLQLVEVRWLELGFSFNKGPGKLSKIWKPHHSIKNPIWDSSTAENNYRYINYNDRRHWFLYNRKSNSSKSLLNFIELF